MRPEDWAAIAPRITDVWGKPMHRGTVEAWYVELQGQDGQDVRAALVSLSRTEDRAPSLARLISASYHARKVRRQDEPTLTTRPGDLPEGVAAIVRSKNFADIAVMLDDRGELPEGIEITSVEGRLPAYMPAKVPA